MARKILVCFVLSCLFSAVAFADTLTATKVLTRGNHTFIRLSHTQSATVMSGDTDDVDMEDQILLIKDQFETNNRHLEITGWQVQSATYATLRNTTITRYRGIWVDHKPSGKPSKKDQEKEKNRWPDPAEPNRDGGRRF